MTGIIILNYNTPQDTLKCIDFIMQRTTSEYKIYVVDNCSKDNSVDIIERGTAENNKVKLIISKINGGYSQGNNLGIKLAVEDGCDKIVVLNPDVEIKDGAIDKMALTMEKDESIAIVGPKIYKEDGVVQSLLINGLSFKKFLFNKQPLRFLYKLFGGRKYLDYGHKNINFEQKTQLDGMVSGCCFMARSNYFESIGYFDARVFLYCEEEILWEEVKKRKWKVVYDPDAEVLHYGSLSIGGWLSPFSRRCLAESRLYFQSKYAENFRGIRKCLAELLTKSDYVLIGKILKQDYKGEYIVLKEKINSMDKCL